jgi:hypothetical protein
MNKLLIARLVIKNRWTDILFAIGITLAITWYVNPWAEKPNNDWWGWMEPITGISTLAIAMLVWLGKSIQDVENALPKRLSVSFFHNNEEIMFCSQAYLAGEGDIRQWGQQIGKQMNQNEWLDLAPDILVLPREKTLSKLTGEPIILYKASFFLTKPPKVYTGTKIEWEQDAKTGKFEAIHTT